MYNSSWATARTTSLAVAAITGLLWLEIAYQFGANSSSGDLSYSYDRFLYSIGPIIGSLMCAASSFIAIYGVLKKLPICVFPWIAIHTVFLGVVFSVVISTMLYTLGHARDISLIVIPHVICALITASLTYMWGGIYVHFTKMYIPVPSAPVAASQVEKLKTLGSCWAKSPTIMLGLAAITGPAWLLAAYQCADGSLRPIPYTDEGEESFVYRIGPFISCLMCSASSFLAIHGFFKRRPNCMFPWIAIHTVLLGLGILFVLTKLLFIVGHDRSTPIAVIHRVIGAVMLASLAFLWCGLYTHFTHLYTLAPSTPISRSGEQENSYRAV